jgi:hypothetical protein
MTLGTHAIAELAIAELDSAFVAPPIGCLEIEAALLWEFCPDAALLWDMEIQAALLWNLQPQAHLEGDTSMTVCSTIDIGATVVLSAVATFQGSTVDATAYTLQIKTPDRRQWPDIDGSRLTLNTETGRYEFRYHLRGDYAQAGTHYYRFKAVVEDDDNPDDDATGAGWNPLIVRAMPFAET